VNTVTLLYLVIAGLPSFGAVLSALNRIHSDSKVHMCRFRLPAALQDDELFACTALVRRPHELSAITLHYALKQRVNKPDYAAQIDTGGAGTVFVVAAGKGAT
jgi:hypothetical protein